MFFKRMMARLSQQNAQIRYGSSVGGQLGFQTKKRMRLGYFKRSTGVHGSIKLGIMLLQAS